MRTLRDACIELGVTYRTLEKWMQRLQITPARHPRDYRFYVLDDDQVEAIRVARSEMPFAGMAVRTPRRQEPAIEGRRRPITPTPLAQQSDLALSASLVQLPGNLVTVEAFGNLHGVKRQTWEKAIRAGRLSVVRGEWKVPRGQAKYALDDEGRRRFVELWRHLDHFVRCDACPHS